MAWTLRFMPDRPFIEPPADDYDIFLDEIVPSNRRLEMLFPNNVELRMRYQDSSTERDLLFTY